MAGTAAEIEHARRRQAGIRPRRQHGAQAFELGALRTAYRQDKAALTDALRTPASSTRGIRSVLQKLSRLTDQHLCAIRAASGVPHINHPNFGWAVTADELAAVENNRLFEIFNGHPQVTLVPA